MNWSLCWSEVFVDVHLPAINQRREDGSCNTLVPLALFDVKIFQTITDASAQDFVTQLQTLPTTALSLEQAQALNRVLRSDCAREFGDLRLNPGPDQLASEVILQSMTGIIFQMRERELVNMHLPNLVPQMMKITSGWLTINDCEVPYVSRGLTILVPRNLVLRACGTNEDEEIESWHASAAESFLLIGLMQQHKGNLPWWPGREVLVMQQLVIVLSHRIFNGPRIHGERARNLLLRHDQGYSTTGPSSPNIHDVHPTTASSPSLSIVVPPEVATQQRLMPEPFALLLVKRMDVLSVLPSLSITFCIARLRSNDVNDPELPMPCFYRCMSVAGAGVFVETVRLQFFPNWTFVKLMHVLRSFINHSKFLNVETAIVEEYNKVFPASRVVDLPQAVDLRALLASLMLVRMEYRASLP